MTCTNTDDTGYVEVPIDASETCVSLEALTTALADVLYHSDIEWPTAALYEAFRSAMMRTPATDPLPPYQLAQAALDLFDACQVALDRLVDPYLGEDEGQRQEQDIALLVQAIANAKTP